MGGRTYRGVMPCGECGGRVRYAGDSTCATCPRLVIAILEAGTDRLGRRSEFDKRMILGAEKVGSANAPPPTARQTRQYLKAARKLSDGLSMVDLNTLGDA